MNRDRLPETTVHFDQDRAEQGRSGGDLEAAWHTGEKLFDGQFLLDADDGMDGPRHPDIGQVGRSLRQDLFVRRLDMGMRPDDRRDLPIQIVPHGHLLGRRFRVHVDDDDARFGFEPPDLALRDLERTIERGHECTSHQLEDRHPFAEFVPLSATRADDVKRLLGIVRPYLPEQPWWYDEETLTDRSERFLASEIIREKLFRLTGDELPYASTVVIDKFEEEPAQRAGRMVRLAATIVVERDAHKGMVIGNGGERLKRIGSEARQELESLMQGKVFLELWVKVRSGWADDEAHLRSYGYE